MSSERLARTSFIDPRSNQPRGGTAQLLENHLDQEQHTQPLVRAHASSLHGWGIADGLTIAATLGAAQVRVQAGVALDARGQHISLAVGGKAEVGPTADGPNVRPTLTDVTATGAVLPTAGLTGTFYVTATFRETFNEEHFVSSGRREFQLMHTPWLRLEPAGGVTDTTDIGVWVVLGRVDCAAGKVTALTHERRRGVSLPAAGLRVSRSTTATASAVATTATTPSGEIKARAAGGLEITVPGGSDQIDIHADRGSIAKVSVGADQIVGRRADGRETVVLTPPSAQLQLGTTGVAGTVVINDAQNRRAVVCAGGDASLALGVAGNSGDIKLVDNAGQTAARIDGSNGAIHGRALHGDAVHTARIDAPGGAHLEVTTPALVVHGLDLILDGRSGSGRPFRALVDATNQLIVNFNGDYGDGVQVNGLHLSPHIRSGQWEGQLWEGGRFAYDTWVPLIEFDTKLPFSHWDFVTFCDISMQQDFASVKKFWWATSNASFVNAAGNIVLRWEAYISSSNPGWSAASQKMFWLAYKR